jgi:hypothetical protein
MPSSPATTAGAASTPRGATPTPASAGTTHGCVLFPKVDARSPRGNETQEKRAFCRHFHAASRQNDSGTWHLQREIAHISSARRRRQSPTRTLPSDEP